MSMVQPPVELDRTPSAIEESEAFSTADERADIRNKHHELELLKHKQGIVGRLVGSSDANLTIAFVLLFLGAVGIVSCAIGMLWQPGLYESMINKLITAELTIAGYVMGKKTS